MKARSAAIQGTLAVLGLLAAYYAWQHPPEESEGDVVVLDVTTHDISRIRYDDPKHTVELVRQGDGLWIRDTEKPPPPKPAPKLTVKAQQPDGGTGAVSASATVGSADGGTAAAVASVVSPAPLPKPKTHLYRANSTAEHLLERFAPMMATRALKKLPPEKLKEVGLDQGDRTLTVEARGTPHTWQVATSALGPGAPYFRAEDGNVFVMKGTLVTDLEYASSRLVDRRLHAFSLDDWDGVRVKIGEKQRALTRKGERLLQDGKVDEFATNWHEKIWRVLGIEVLGKGESPASGEPKIELRLDYSNAGKDVGFIELGHSGKDVFARTEHTAGWVRVHAAMEQVLTEAQKVVGNI